MADAPAYTTVPGKIPTLLNKMREVGVPSKATRDWLKSLGLKSSNDSTLIPVLRQIGFIDAGGAPQPAWKQYRGADHKKVLGRAIRQGYQDLYRTYEDAHNRNSTDLGHVLSTKTDAGQQAIAKVVATFKNLAAAAEFDDATRASPEATEEINGGQGEPPPGDVSSRRRGREPGTSGDTGVTVNVNIQLTLPETTDDAVFESFFKAMRKHLIAPDGE